MSLKTSAQNKNGRSYSSFLRIFAVVVFLLYVTTVLRGVYLASYPGNRDVLGFIAGVTVRSSGVNFLLGYDFTLGLGNRLEAGPSWLNPISALQHLVGATHAVWVGNLTFLMLFLVAIYVVSRLFGLAAEAAVLSATLFGVWCVIPSSLRVGKLSDFGGSFFSFSIFSSLVGLALAMWILDDLKNPLKHILLQSALIWMIAGTGLGQPLLIQSQQVLWLALAIASSAKGNAKRISLWFGSLMAHLAVALFNSAIIAGSPIVAILSSANSRPDSYRGLESDSASIWVLWNYLGSFKLVRFAVLAAVVGMTVFVRRKKHSNAQRLVRLLLACGVVVQVYAFLWHYLFGEHGLEIGVRPFYLTEAAFVPILSLALATATVFLADWVVERGRLLLQAHWLKVSGGVLAAVLLPMFLLSAWTFKNPTVASVALDPSASTRLPDELTKISALNGVVGARVMVIDPGIEVLDDVWLPDDYFQRIVNREAASKDEIRYVVHSHSLTRWQHWLFEEFSATSGTNGAIFLWSREFKTDLVNLLQPTHVLSSSPLLSPQLHLRSSNAAGDGYLYEVKTLAQTSPGSRKVISAVADSVDVATRRAVMGSSTVGTTVVGLKPLGSLFQASEFEYEITRDRIEVTASSAGASVVYLPIEYSRCHQLHTDAGDSPSTRLLPLNGRFLGVFFVGSLDATITFREHGPLGLACQLRDYWETRNIG